MSDRVDILTVHDRFQIGDRGLYLTPDFSVPKAPWKDRIEKVTIITPDGVSLEATADLGLSHFNIPDPSVRHDARWRIILEVTDRKKEEVPIGSRILASPEVIRALEIEGSNQPLQRTATSRRL